MDIEIKDLQISKKYVSGLNMGDYAQREYEYEIHNTDLKGKIIVHETYTPRINEFEWGVQENIYYVKDNPKKTFKNIKPAFNYLIKTLKETLNQ